MSQCCFIYVCMSELIEIMFYFRRCLTFFRLINWCFYGSINLLILEANTRPKKNEKQWINTFSMFECQFTVSAVYRVAKDVKYLISPLNLQTNEIHNVNERSLYCETKIQFITWFLFCHLHCAVLQHVISLIFNIYIAHRANILYIAVISEAEP